MNEKREIIKVRILGYIALAFLVSMFKSCTELRYSLYGKTASAEFYDSHDAERSSKIAMYYKFQNAEGKTVKGRVDVYSEEANSLKEHPIQAIYIPSNPRTNTLVSLREWHWVIIFCVLLTILAGGCAWLFFTANADLKRREN